MPEQTVNHNHRQSVDSPVTDPRDVEFNHAVDMIIRGAKRFLEVARDNNEETIPVASEFDDAHSPRIPASAYYLNLATNLWEDVQGAGNHSSCSQLVDDSGSIELVSSSQDELVEKLTAGAMQLSPQKLCKLMANLQLILSDCMA